MSIYEKTTQNNPTKTQEVKEIKTPVGLFTQTPNVNVNDNENDNVNDNENDNVNDNENKKEKI